MKYIIIVVILWMNITAMMGQTYFNESRNTLNVSLNKLVSLSIPAFVVSSHHRLAENVYLDYGLGYIFKNDWGGAHQFSDIDKYSGARVRLGGRYIVPSSGLNGNAWYFGVLGKYSYMQGENKALVWQGDNTYARYTTFDMEAHRINYNIIGGYIITLNKRFFVDIGLGLGKAFIWQENTIPTGGEIRLADSSYFFGLNNESNNGSAADLEVQFSVGYIIN